MSDRGRNGEYRPVRDRLPASDNKEQEDKRGGNGGAQESAPDMRLGWSTGDGSKCHLVFLGLRAQTKRQQRKSAVHQMMK